MQSEVTFYISFTDSLITEYATIVSAGTAVILLLVLQYMPFMYLQLGENSST